MIGEDSFHGDGKALVTATITSLVIWSKRLGGDIDWRFEPWRSEVYHTKALNTRLFRVGGEETFCFQLLRDSR